MYMDLFISLHQASDGISLRVDRLEWFEGERQFLLLTLLIENRTNKDTETIIRDSVEQLQLLLS
jgi:hypothetical protein